MSLKIIVGFDFFQNPGNIRCVLGKLLLLLGGFGRPQRCQNLINGILVL